MGRPVLSSRWPLSERSRSHALSFWQVTHIKRLGTAVALHRLVRNVHVDLLPDELLLATVLGVTAPARRLLANTSLVALANMDATELRRRGLSPSQIARLQCAHELARRGTAPPYRRVVTCAEHAAANVRRLVKSMDDDHQVVIALGSHNRVLCQTPIAPFTERDLRRDVLAVLLQWRAAAGVVVLTGAHTPADVTRAGPQWVRMQKAGASVGVVMLDWILASDTHVVSMAQRGALAPYEPVAQIHTGGIVARSDIP